MKLEQNTKRGTKFNSKIKRVSTWDTKYQVKEISPKHKRLFSTTNELKLASMLSYNLQLSCRTPWWRLMWRLKSNNIISHKTPPVLPLVQTIPILSIAAQEQTLKENNYISPPLPTALPRLCCYSTGQHRFLVWSSTAALVLSCLTSEFNRILNGKSLSAHEQYARFPPGFWVFSFTSKFISIIEKYLGDSNFNKT